MTRSSSLPDGRQPPRGPAAGVALAIVATALAALVGAVAVVMSSTDQERRATAAQAGPIDTAPLDLATVADPIAVHYRAAEADPVTYREVPCYCGCEEFLGHRHLYDCFVRADGRGWDTHAAGCGICIAESITVQALLDDGLDAPAIRDAVITQYGATTTPTTAPTATTPGVDR
jgi:hypothetical protein